MDQTGLGVAGLFHRRTSERRCAARRLAGLLAALMPTGCQREPCGSKAMCLAPACKSTTADVPENAWRPAVAAAAADLDRWHAPARAWREDNGELTRINRALAASRQLIPTASAGSAAAPGQRPCRPRRWPAAGHRPVAALWGFHADSRTGAPRARRVGSVARQRARAADVAVRRPARQQPQPRGVV